ncbi:MAG: hypothetical protein ACFFAS_12180 [Promethearchaeota archaeon]
MVIKIRGAQEHNLKKINVEIKKGLTVVTGVSGSGKTSLVFDTLYKEARRRFLEAFSINKDEMKLNPAKVDSISGLGPTIALGQNLLNRNPNSTLGSAAGFIPLFKILFARFGKRKCHACGAKLSVLNEDETIAQIDGLRNKETLQISAILVKNAKGSHRTLIELLQKEFGTESVLVDGNILEKALNPNEPHDIQVVIGLVSNKESLVEIREILRTISSLGANSLIINGQMTDMIVSRANECVECGAWFANLEPSHFKKSCPSCKGNGCSKCNNTGYHPYASNTTWEDLLFPDVLKMSVGDLISLFSKNDLPIKTRLLQEIKKRLLALSAVGLKYLSLNRITPTLSRGESQRVRLAISLLNELEDVTHIFDEPTIGQHPADVARLMPVLERLAGTTVFIEHDRQAVMHADNVIDIGPGAGNKGGEVIFTGTPAELWKAETPTGRFFSSRQHIKMPKSRKPPEEFFKIKSASLHNLKNINIKIPLNRLTVITGVSGSGKSTLIESVLYESLKNGKPIGCKSIEGITIKPVLMDQGPIGKNPRSNPATYTKIADVIRKLYAKATKFKATCFSFNTPEGACETCNGMGALEIKMRYLPSSWITCSDCEGRRFSEDILDEKVKFGDKKYDISEFYDLPISKVAAFLEKEDRISLKDLASARQMISAMNDIGLGYISLGQPSPTLSGGEAQRVKLSKYLGRSSLNNQLIILDEPSTGLHSQNLAGLLLILERLLKAGATLVVVEHNTDVIRAADWIIDLGPESGPKGGYVVYEGNLKGLLENKHSLTAKALREEQDIIHLRVKKGKNIPSSSKISIQGAHIHNLKNINVNIPKRKFIVVTGVSGSGKSSLIMDTLETEARRRYLETLSMYERQGTKEDYESQVDSVKGLGITALISPESLVRGWIYNVRYTIGRVTDIILHLATIFSYMGKRKCPKCSGEMKRKELFVCEKCDVSLSIPKPRHFVASNYSAACLKCHGVGSLQVPNPDKLIIHPDKALCSGAMYSPGFFPKGYLCKPYNVGYYIVKALADKYGFDQLNTPWKDMSEEAKRAFLYGTGEPLKIEYENKKGQKSIKKINFLGFYEQWLRDWDVGGTYTDTKTCEECNGTKLRPKYLEVTFLEHNIHELLELPLSDLHDLIKKQSLNDLKHDFVKNSFQIVKKRLEFLNRTGLGYINLNRVAESLSAGEAQRVKLASLIGSDLSSLTVIVDEPSRGLHPTELNALLEVLLELRDKGNSVIAIEHDLLFIENADHIIDMGPGAGANGGSILVAGSPDKILKAGTITSEWLNGNKKLKIDTIRKEPTDWIRIYGARANNLKGDLVEIPRGILTGICGVSGSGKSSLIVDTLGRALVPAEHTTSVAREPTEPGVYDRIEGKFERTIIIDQNRAKISNIINFLGLHRPILKVFASTEDAKVLGLKEKDLAQKCSACKGRGYIKMDMNFLPDIIEECETCKGSGYFAEAWQIRYNDCSLAEISDLSVKETLLLFNGHDNIVSKLDLVKDAGLSYLKLNQLGRTLSGGEAQRLKVVKELAKKSNKESLYILDEPTIGQHLEEVSTLVRIVRLLIKKGHSVIVIEHHPHLLACCDWLIELGPKGGPEGGYIIAKGTPETIAKGKTPTAQFIKKVLEKST